MINLLQEYLDPNRHYHNIEHISNMLSNSNVFQLNLSDRIKLHTAIVYHDIVYDPTSNSNEEDSAKFFMTDLMNGEIKYNQKVISHSELSGAVWVMIHSTKDHIPTSDMCKYIIDLDLWELADSEKYIKNRALIRKEYSMYSDRDFLLGRNEWIESMLNKKQIYYTDYCIENGFEENARKNLLVDLNE